MGLFNKKKCMYCGGKVGLLGGNSLKETDEVMCDKCRKEKSSPFILTCFFTKEEFEEHCKVYERVKELRASFVETDKVVDKKKTLLSIDSEKRLFIFPDDYRMEKYDVLSFNDIKDFHMEFDYDMFPSDESNPLKYLKKYNIPYADMPVADKDGKIMNTLFVVDFNENAYLKDSVSFKIGGYEEIQKGYDNAAAIYEAFMKYTGIIKEKK